MSHIRSMTGFGQAAIEREGLRIVVDARSVNHRYADVRLRLPGELAPLEPELRRIALGHIRRGRVELTLRLTAPDGADGRAVLNRPLLEELIGTVEELRERGFAGDLAVADVVSVPGMFKVEAAESDLGDEERAAAREAVAQALTVLDDDRKREGERLADELRSRLDAMQGLLEKLRDRAGDVPPTVRSRLQERLDALGSVVELDPARVVQEAALLAERCDVTEELVRLAAHLEQAREILTGGRDEAVGKRLDFLVQEIQRETNTTGSKSADLELTRLALAMKAENEKFREQVQNLE